MTTAHFNRTAGAVAKAMAEAYRLAHEQGVTDGLFKCPACGGVVHFTAKPNEPHKSAGGCSTPRCVRWAQQ